MDDAVGASPPPAVDTVNEPRPADQPASASVSGGAVGGDQPASVNQGVGMKYSDPARTQRQTHSIVSTDACALPRPPSKPGYLKLTLKTRF